MTEVRNGVQIEPSLQPLSVETLSGDITNSNDGARLNIAANGVRYDRSYLMFAYLIHTLHPTELR